MDTAFDLAPVWRQYASTRSIDLRNQLVESQLELARTIAALLYRQRGGLEVEFGDYLQLATLGLIEAVDRFDPARGVAFASFASLRIRGSVLNGLAGLSEQYQQIDLRKRLRQERIESLRQPGGARRDLFGSLAEMAVGLALSHLLDGSRMLQNSSSEPAYRQDFYDAAQERQLRRALERLVLALPEQERRVMRYHYFQNIGFTEVAGLLGLSKGRVSQIHRQALLLLRDLHGARSTLQRDL